MFTNKIKAQLPSSSSALLLTVASSTSQQETHLITILKYSVLIYIEFWQNAQIGVEITESEWIHNPLVAERR